MSRQIFIAILGVILIASGVLIPLANNVSADKTIINKCKIDKDTGTCVFDQTFKSKKERFIVKNEIDASAIANANSGGGGVGGTVDMEARAAVESLEGRVNDTDNRIDQTNVRIDRSDEKITNLETNVTSLTEADVLFDQRIGQLADLANNHTAEIAELWEAVNEAITDIEPGAGENQTDNQTGNVTEPTEPTDNQTGGNVTEPTEPTEPVGNQTDGGFPPINVTEPTEPVDNQTNNGNATQPTDNQTEIDDNLTDTEDGFFPTTFSFEGIVDFLNTKG